MAVTPTRHVVVRRPAEQVAALATLPRVALPHMAGIGRFEQITDDEDGLGEWDVFLDIGTIHVGGRVVVSRPDDRSLSWVSVRGTSHAVDLRVHDHDQGARLELRLRVELTGFLTGRLTELVTAGLVGRHVEAGLQQLRHHLEFGER